MESCVLVRREEAMYERIMNEENDWERNVEGDAVVPVACISREEVYQALNENRKRP